MREANAHAEGLREYEASEREPEEAPEGELASDSREYTGSSLEELETVSADGRGYKSEERRDKPVAVYRVSGGSRGERRGGGRDNHVRKV